MKNRLLFRDVNERVRELGDADAASLEFVDFLCECADPQCLGAVQLRADQYERVRSNPAHFLVMRGHEEVAQERVVAVEDGFVVVEKLPAEQPRAGLSDTRS